MLELAQWLKERYYCTLFEAAKLMIPTGYHLRLQDSCVLSPEFRDFDRENYTETQWRAILFLRGRGSPSPWTSWPRRRAWRSAPQSWRNCWPGASCAR